MYELPPGFVVYFTADFVELVMPDGTRHTEPPETSDEVLWERAWEHASERWYCGDATCWLCVEDGRVPEEVRTMSGKRTW